MDTKGYLYYIQRKERERLFFLGFAGFILKVKYEFFFYLGRETARMRGGMVEVIQFGFHLLITYNIYKIRL